jgi:hypothetical protein
VQPQFNPLQSEDYFINPALLIIAFRSAIFWVKRYLKWVDDKISLRLQFVEYGLHPQPTTLGVAVFKKKEF